MEYILPKELQDLQDKVGSIVFNRADGMSEDEVQRAQRCLEGYRIELQYIERSWLGNSELNWTFGIEPTRAAIEQMLATLLPKASAAPSPPRVSPAVVPLAIPRRRGRGRTRSRPSIRKRKFGVVARAPAFEPALLQPPNEEIEFGGMPKRRRVKNRSDSGDTSDEDEEGGYALDDFGRNSNVNDEDLGFSDWYVCLVLDFMIERYGLQHRRFLYVHLILRRVHHLADSYACYHVVIM